MLGDELHDLPRNPQGLQACRHEHIIPLNMGEEAEAVRDEFMREGQLERVNVIVYLPFVGLSLEDDDIVLAIEPVRSIDGIGPVNAPICRRETP